VPSSDVHNGNDRSPGMNIREEDQFIREGPYMTAAMLLGVLVLIEVETSKAAPKIHAKALTLKIHINYRLYSCHPSLLQEIHKRQETACASSLGSGRSSWRQRRFSLALSDGIVVSSRLSL